MSTATKRYAKTRVGIDAVIFTVHEKELYVALLEREKQPFKGTMELPGGLLLPDETADETLNRKLYELVGKVGVYFEQFYTFTNPKRDPRERTISIGFIALVDGLVGDDDVFWFPAKKLPEVAFDHLDITKYAHAYLKRNIDALIAKQLLPKYFPLNDMQAVYEAIEDKEYDNRNFRKRVLASGLVKPTKKKQDSVSHRPATLYTFSRSRKRDS